MCRVGREAGLTWRSRGTHLPPRAPLPPVAGRWQLRCGQHPGCRRQQAPWQLKTQRVGLGQKSQSLRAHSPSPLPREIQPTAPSGWLGAGKELFPLLVPDLSLFQSTLLGNPMAWDLWEPAEETTSPALQRGGAHHPGCGRCRTHPERLEQEGRAKGSD